MPSIAVSSNNQAIKNLVVSQADTVQIHVGCFPKCQVVAESELIDITSIGDGSFIFKPKKAGNHEVQVYTLCPEGTSGKLPIGSWQVEAI